MQFDEMIAILETPVFGSITFFILGLLFGSFITAASHRLPKKEDIVKARSACPVCHHVLGVLDLFPVISWVCSGGKCRYCKTKVSVRYPLIELGSGGSFLAVYCMLGVVWYLPVVLGVVVMLWVAMVVWVEQEKQLF